jgi:hypothetical protein
MKSSLNYYIIAALFAGINYIIACRYNLAGADMNNIFNFPNRKNKRHSAVTIKSEKNLIYYVSFCIGYIIAAPFIPFIVLCYLGRGIYFYIKNRRAGK